jgi:Uma2 family endonuclease
MLQSAREWTVAEVLAFPADGNRHEVVDGKLLVTPSPAYHHQAAILALVRRLDPFVRSARLGRLSIAPADIVLDDRTLVQPDVFVFTLPGGARPTSWKDIRDLLLAIEVLSPATARADRTVKRRRYQRSGVPQYWIVDLDARIVERWTPSDERPEVLHETLAWRPDPGAPGLAIDLPELFREILDA